MNQNKLAEYFLPLSFYSIKSVYSAVINLLWDCSNNHTIYFFEILLYTISDSYYTTASSSLCEFQLSFYVSPHKNKSISAEVEFY
jgi:hypothetical protein